MLKQLAVLVVSTSIVLGFASPAPATGKGGGPRGVPVHVRAYTRKDGTFVQAHYRSAPDGIFSNNWTTKGNINPYTGVPGTRTVNPNKGRVGIGTYPVTRLPGLDDASTNY